MGSQSSTLKKNPESVSFSRLRFDSPSIASPRQRHNLLSQRRPGDASPKRVLQRSSSFTKATHILPNEYTPLVPPKLGGTLKIDGASPLESEVSFEAPTAPAFIVWITPALLCAMAYALYNIFIKKGSNSIHPVLGGVILQIVAALLGALLLMMIILRDGSDTLQFDQTGIYWSIAAGVAVGAAEMLSFFVMGMGVQAMQAVPIIIGGSVMFGTILGAIWLQEILTAQGWSGVVLLVIGIVMVATDPGSGLGEGH